ncbi:FAD binding domain-containing protein [Aspergillus pseudoustus]|uniref:FAD binding domain-containing protein n=1 Tax=Aspergillus pseudoustus TaxID=1810923 RepID=A0ABR4JAN8_9EURO
MRKVEHQETVLVVGGGPVGMLTAWQLAQNGVKCMLIERNPSTTVAPKMDITNCRSMELLKLMGLADKLREQGVGQDYSLDVIFCSGLGRGGEVLGKWDLPSPKAWRTKIKNINDGSMPREPYQRCSQAIFEAWLKPFIEAHLHIESYWGMKFESLEERNDGVVSHLVDVATGEVHTVNSKYVVGCDGANSLVRMSVRLEIPGDPVDNKVHLVHFKSRDLTKLQTFGQFWHIFFTNGACIISQDEVDTWTVHLVLPPDDTTTFASPKEVIATALGAATGPVDIEVDEILLYNVWTPNLAVADSYSTEKGRVFLAGDSAHQNVPTGGYGMNTGVGDAFDISWKLAAVINGYGGDHLLKSYNLERRPVAVRNVERSMVHASVHQQYTEWVTEKGPDSILSDSKEAQELKSEIRNLVQENDGENKDHGIELGYRFPHSPIIISEVTAAEDEAEEWPAREYIPSTAPGGRAPHVFLRDGTTSIFDLYGKGFTIIDFTRLGRHSEAFKQAASEFGIPLKVVHLPNEPHVRDVWKCTVALLRPDGFVSWRSNDEGESVPLTTNIRKILLRYVPFSLYLFMMKPQ